MLRSKIQLNSLVIAIFILIPLVLICIPISQASFTNNYFEEQHITTNNPILIAGSFQYFDITLSSKADKIIVVAYHGDSIPELQDRSPSNYYRWEYDSGIWRDVSGHESLYIEPSSCYKKDHTYSFYLGVDSKASPGRWTIKIIVNDKEVSSSPSFVVVSGFHFFLSSIIGLVEPRRFGSRSLFDLGFFTSDRKKALFESERISVEERVDEVLKRHSSSDKKEESDNDESLDMIVFDESHLKDEIIKSSISNYPKSKFKIVKIKTVKSNFLNGGKKNNNDFWTPKLNSHKKILTILFTLFILLTFFYPQVSFVYKELESSFKNFEPFIYFEKPKNSFGTFETKKINWNYFWSFFGENSGWYLEAYNSDTDDWTSINEYLTVERVLSRDKNYEKSTLCFTAPHTTDYRLTFSIDKPVKDYINRSKYYEYILTYAVNETEYYTVFFNWSDMIGIQMPLVFEYGIDNFDEEDYFYFKVSTGDTSNPVDDVPEGYNVLLDPTFGDTGSGGSTVTIEDQIVGGYFQMGPNNATGDSITAYLNLQGVSKTAKCALYNSSGSFVPNSETQALIYSTGYNTFNFGATKPVLKANEWYYIVVWSTSGGNVGELYYVNAGGNGVFSDSQTYNGFPATFAANTVDADGIARIYCTYSETYDADPPTPDPMTWNTEPYNVSSSSITMVATTANDDTTPISYYFNETTGNLGGTDSSWQEGTTYTDEGLSENTQYGYQVKARDSNSTPNEGNYSTPISYEYTGVDPPTDDELTFTRNVTWINATVVLPPNPTSDSTGSYFNWITGGADNSGWQNGVYYHNRTGLTENTNYGFQVRYRNGDAEASSYNPSEKTNYTLCYSPNDGEFTIDGHGVNWINMSVAHPTNPTSGGTAAYFKCVAGGALDSGWVTDSYSGRYYYNATGLSSETTYGFIVKYRNGNGVETTYTNEKQETTDAGAATPTVLTNESTGVEETNATIQGWLQDNGSADTTCYFLWDTNSPPTANNASQGIIANGAQFSLEINSLTIGQIYFFDTKANNSQGWYESGGVKALLTKPNPPNTLTAQTNSSSIIYLTWLIGPGANTTYIERNTAATWAQGDGIEIYNGTGTNYEDTDLTGGTTYFYQAWSYANWTYTTTLHQYSDDNVSASNTTKKLPTINNEIPTNESTGISVTPQLGITVNDAEGESMTIIWYSNSSGSWLPFGTNVTGADGNGTYYQTNSNFSNYSITYYWNVSVSDATDTNNSNIFHFTTEGIDTSIDPISPYTITYSPFTISATGDSNLDQIELYYRWSDDNQSWAPWSVLTYDDFEVGDFGNYTDGGIDCELYNGVTYAHGSYSANIQDDSGDESSFYHSNGIDVDTTGYTRIKVDFYFYSLGLDPGHDFFVEYYNGTAWQIVATYIANTDFVNDQWYHKVVWINETTYTFPSNMQIKFRCDAANNNDDVYIDDIWINATTEDGGGDGLDWISWSDINNPDGTYPWDWAFNFPNSNGYYEFYSIGSKSGSLDETAPAIADAFCYYSHTVIIINSYDLVNSSGSKLNNATGLLDVNSEYTFTLNITDSNGWDELEYINITSWYDNGSEATTYNQTLGGNLNMFLQYENTTGTGQFRMLWPDDEAQLISGNCTETIISSTTHVINISFKPRGQVRWADSNNSWDNTQNTTNDPYSWNFNITITDVASKENWKTDEYGIYRYTSIKPNSDWVDVIAAPGSNDDSSIVTITYSSNYDFNMSIYFEENLTNITWADSIEIANNVLIRANADPNDDITSNLMFAGIGESNAIDIFNDSGIFEANGIGRNVNVQFNVGIPFGKVGGKYTARVAIKINQN